VIYYYYLLSSLLFGDNGHVGTILYSIRDWMNHSTNGYEGSGKTLIHWIFHDQPPCCRSRFIQYGTQHTSLPYTLSSWKSSRYTQWECSLQLAKHIPMDHFRAMRLQEVVLSLVVLVLLGSIYQWLCGGMYVCMYVCTYVLCVLTWNNNHRWYVPSMDDHMGRSTMPGDWLWNHLGRNHLGSSQKKHLAWSSSSSRAGSWYRCASWESLLANSTASCFEALRMIHIMSRARDGFLAIILLVWSVLANTNSL